MKTAVHPALHSCPMDRSGVMLGITWASHAEAGREPRGNCPVWVFTTVSPLAIVTITPALSTMFSSDAVFGEKCDDAPESAIGSLGSVVVDGDAIR